ncbi:TonB-dependent receptor [Shewanella goraebulensis]|uniref:TonB-dependent receptor n=1 Tax=Shewanella goraebulensis TaxID=3050637 RepID=UPI00254FB8C3|nr:TonB-dependent receptor [Shewanella goraebulensis]
MSKSQFSLSVIASAVLFVCHSGSSFAATSVTASMDESNNTVVLNQPQTAPLHYRDSTIPLAFSGMTVLPNSHGQATDVTHRGAMNGIAITQDRVSFSPSPYAAPQLVLQPNLALQSKISTLSLSDVTKGGMGAFGHVNYTSAQISSAELGGRANIEINENGDGHVGAIASGLNKEYGMMLAVDYQNTAQETGFVSGFDDEQTHTDIMFKINADSLVGARNPQQTEFMYQYTNSDSGFSNIGLTAQDWATNPGTRYSATQNDKQEGQRHKYQVSHIVDLTGGTQMVSDFYYQSYDEQKSQLNSLDGTFIGLSELQTIADFDMNPVGSNNLSSMLEDNHYAGYGLQTEGTSQYGEHQVTYGALYHSDKAEMKFGQQDWLWSDDRSLSSINVDKAVLAYVDDVNVLTTTADAKLNYGALSFNLGLAFENVSTTREVSTEAYGIEAADFSDDGWIPSIEIAYATGAWKAAIAAKQAWSAAAAGNATQQAQESMQYQLGLTYQTDTLNLGVNIYMQDFDNQHISCMWSMACDYSQRYVQENIEDVSVNGVDVSADYQFAFDSFAIPISIQYQYSQAEFGESGTNDLIGLYVEGEQLPWVPEQQLALSSGIIVGKFSFMAQGLYQSELGYATAFNGGQQIDEQWKVDIAANYHISEVHEIYLRVENVLDEDLVSQQSSLGISSQGEMLSYLGYQARF